MTNPFKKSLQQGYKSSPGELERMKLEAWRRKSKEEKDVERIARLLAPRAQADWSAPYKYGHLGLMIRAAEQQAKAAPLTTNHRITDFSDWVFSLHCHRGTRQSSLDAGRAMEYAIRERRRKEWAKAQALGIFGAITHPEWALDYVDPLDDAQEAFEASTLTIHGKSMWGRPDLAFRHRHTGTILIVENKASDAPVPSDGWPNARAQLWAYSQLDRYRDAPEILLALNVFSDIRIGSDSTAFRTEVRRWNGRSPSINRECRYLFDCYKSLCEGTPIPLEPAVTAEERQERGLPPIPSYLD